MPYASPRVRCWCGTTGDCPHQKKEQSTRDNSVKHLYDCAAWRKRFSPMMRRLNPLCQYIEFDGVTGQREQCRTPSQVVHHLKDPKDAPALFFEPSNVCCLCSAHHPGGQQGTDWKVGVDYVPTNTPKHSIPRG